MLSRLRRLPRLPRVVLDRLGRAWLTRRLKAEADTQKTRPLGWRAFELAFLFRHWTRLAPQTVLDVGSGQTPLPAAMRHLGAIVTAIDNVRDYWPQGMFNPHWHVLDDDITRTQLPADAFDLVACIGTLQHIKDLPGAVRGLAKVTRPGGHVVITCAYTEGQYTVNCYAAALARPEYRSEQDYVCRSYSRKELHGTLAEFGLVPVDQEWWQCFTGPHWAVGERLVPPLAVGAADLHQYTCLLAQKSAS